MKIRETTAKDEGAVQEILVDAFQGTEEAELVLRLEQAGLVLEGLSLVAEMGGIPVGFLLFTAMSIVGADGATLLAIAVAPLGIKTEYQGRGIGTQLMKAGLSAAKEQGHTLALLLGNPEYYHRFGFETAMTYGIQSPFDVEDSYFMVKFLQEIPEKNSKGKAVYPEAWNE